MDNLLGTTAAGLPYGIFNYLYILAVIIPVMAVAIRRLHDVGKSGWFVLIILVPVVGLVWLLTLFCSEGMEGDNRYGSKPEKMATIIGDKFSSDKGLGLIRSFLS